MKHRTLHGAIAAMAMIVTAHAHTISNRYSSPALVVFITPFLRNAASQPYPENNIQQTQGVYFDPFYNNNVRWSRIQPGQNPYSYSYNRQYDRNRPSLPEVTRTDSTFGVKESRSREVSSDNRNVQIVSRIAPQDDIEVTSPTLVENTNKINLAVVPLHKEENVARFANAKPDIGGTANPEFITFRDRQAEREDDVNNNIASLALTGFGLTMMKALNEEGINNPSISPYSVAELLALLQQGAAGNSEAEITKALIMTPSNAKETFRALLSSVKSRSTRNVLKIATNIFVNNVFDLNKNFKNTAIQNFDSDVTPMNFNEPSNCAQQINSWIAEKTQNRIPDLISADMLGPNTQMVLANAIFFKGIWQNRFNPSNTTSGDFHLSDGNVKRVQYMRSRLGLPVGLDRQTGIRYAVMPFEGEQYKMMFLIPEQDDLKTAIQKLTTEKLLNFLTVTKKDVRVTIPKFSIQSDMDLKTVLNKMGVREIFGSQANLFNVGTYRTISPQITSALHKTVMSIDERGGTAAAVTLFPAVALSFEDSTITFNLNRPFLTILWDAINNVPLFMARVDVPTM